ncbi:discoidin domain-containing protein [Hamadaea sp. NPDC051192]|uniref:discoidin domain-containing protein n=1 Tax=Hamadaea sp. NPDC051192 TaxID=3154940 RepID=UPI00343804BD
MPTKRHLAALAAVLLASSIAIVAQQADAADILLSRNKPVTASSVESSAYAAQFAVDGDAASRWASVEGSDPQWIRVDLGSAVPISRIRLVWEAAYASAYRLEGSADASTWTTIKSASGENGGTDDHSGLTATTRYVRVYGTQRGTAYGYSLFEFEVYGPGGQSATDYQAEDASLAQAAVATNHTGFTGTGFVDYVNVAGGWIQWTITATSAGPATLTVRYANGTTANRPLDVTVNGAAAATGVAFAPTATWDTWATQTIQVTLVAGSNTVRATATASTGGPNVDRLTVGAAGSPGPTSSPSPTGGTGTQFTVAAAGDIAEQCTASTSSCQHPKTAALVTAMNPAFVITMGDNQYDDARLSDFQNYFDKSWGAFKAKMHPAPGNHETYDPAGSMAGYKSYFGSIAYPQGKSYYSYDYGNWHFLVLDSNTLTDSAQLTWLQNDLAGTTKGCVAAYWHHPLFSSGDHGNDPVSRQAWQLLYAAHADLVLNGHDHHYERFGPQSPTAAADPNGLVEVLGGMGGASPYDIVNVQPNSQKRLSGTFGVLKLSFTDTTFSWQLIGTDGTVKDTSPTYTCH